MTDMETRKKALDSLQTALGYRFRDISFLETALTHSSYHEGDRSKGNLNNERLEFLGDAYLDAIIGEELFRRLPDTPEGPLTKLRADIVCEKSLYETGLFLRIGPALLLSPGEEKGGGREKVSILADGVEAVLAAVFLDGGFETLRTVLLSLFASRIKEACEGHGSRDYKTLLQEKLQEKGPAEILYLEEKETGPDHEKTFVVSVLYFGTKMGTGSGHSKKQAEQNAAKEALEGLQ